MVSGHPTSTSIPQVDELSTDIPDLGRHSLYIHLFVLRHSLYIYTRLLVCYCEEGKKKKKPLNLAISHAGRFGT